MRYLLDTCALWDMMADIDMLGSDIIELIEDPEDQMYVSAESVREIVQKFRLGKLKNKKWKSIEDIVPSIETDYDVVIMPVDKYTVRTYSHLRLNEAQDHRDPSDHIIISHAITLHVPLISRDQKFGLYRPQVLKLCYYGRTPLDYPSCHTRFPGSANEEE